jgi:hypothetical protein
VTWWATMTLTAQLPDNGQLRAAAYSLRSAGDTLASQASVTQGVVDALGPGVWQDSTSGRAKTILGTLCTELSTGSSAMHQAADALESLATYAASQQWRYEETAQQLEALVRDPLGDLSAHQLAEAEQLIEERRSIEQNVTQAMGHATEVISATAARASRYHGTGGRSIWSSLKHDVHDISDFVSGIWDGTYDIGKGLVKTVWSLEVLSVKLSAERLLLDPQGFMHDAEHAANTLISTVDYLEHHKKQFVSNLLNLDELRKDPIHWAGELVPTIVLTLVSVGAGSVAAKGAEVTDAVDATAGAAETADAAGAARSFFSPRAVEHITGGNIGSKGWGGLHITPNGVLPPGRRILASGPSDSFGIREVHWQAQDSTGNWVPSDGKFSTLFPNSWSEDDALHAIREAFMNSHPLSSGGWQGEYNGIKIKGFYDENRLPYTGYPVYNPFGR